MTTSNPSPDTEAGLDRRVLWSVLENIGVLDNGTWVRFSEADVTLIADAYDAEYARRSVTDDERWERYVKGVIASTRKAAVG